MKRILVIALSAASLAVAADARAGCLVGTASFGTRILSAYFYVDSSCNSVRQDGWDCFDVSASHRITAVYSGDLAYVEVDGRRLPWPMASDALQLKFNQNFAKNGSKLPKIGDTSFFDTEMLSIMARGGSVTSPARIQGYAGPGALPASVNVREGFAQSFKKGLADTEQACNKIQGTPALLDTFNRLAKAGDIAGIKKLLADNGGYKDLEIGSPWGSILPGKQMTFSVAGVGSRIIVTIK